MEIDPRFREQFDRLLEKRRLNELDKLMSYHGYLDEPPLYIRYDEISFLDGLSSDERNRILIRAAVAHLETILDYSRKYYEGRDYDYFCAVTVTNWESVEEEGAPVVPCFWFANPSHGVFEHLKLDPPTTKESQFVAECLDHSPDYVLNDDLVQQSFGIVRVERVWVQHVSCLAPIKQRQQEP